MANRYCKAFENFNNRHIKILDNVEKCPKTLIWQIQGYIFKKPCQTCLLNRKYQLLKCAWHINSCIFFLILVSITTAPCLHYPKAMERRSSEDWSFGFGTGHWKVSARQRLWKGQGLYCCCLHTLDIHYHQIKIYCHLTYFLLNSLFAAYQYAFYSETVIGIFKCLVLVYLIICKTECRIKMPMWNFKILHVQPLQSILHVTKNRKMYNKFFFVDTKGKKAF